MGCWFSDLDEEDGHDMKVIFLDIDGVLNCAGYRQEKMKEGHFSVVIQPEHLNRLKKIVESTDASIVLISSWRKFWQREGNIDSAGKEIEQAFARTGLFVADKTPVLQDGSRSHEVELWLRNRPYVEQFVILDDNDFYWSKKLRKHWVKCPGDTGLTDQLVETSVEVLSGTLIRSATHHKREIRSSLKLFCKKISRKCSE